MGLQISTEDGLNTRMGLEIWRQISTWVGNNVKLNIYDARIGLFAKA